jgi:protein-tyrosine phosphatase
VAISRCERIASLPLVLKLRSPCATPAGEGETNEMNTHPFDTLPLAEGVKLIFTPCPGTKGVGLTESLAQLRAAGADAVISMTPSDELSNLEVAALPEAVAAAGMHWFHCPVEDDAAPGPAFEQAWAANRDAVMTLVSRQGAIAIHCRGGSGRTGFMAALILREMGMEGARADILVKRLRPKALALPAHTDYLAARDAQQPSPEQKQ